MIWWLLVAFLYVSGATGLALLVVGATGKFPQNHRRMLLGLVFWPFVIWYGLVLAIMDP